VIDAGHTGLVTVTFSPAAVTNYSGEAVIHSDATSGDSRSPVSGAGVADVISPTIQITNPAVSSGVYRTRGGHLNISGTASDNVGVALVQLVNDRDGITRNCSGAEIWNLDEVPLFAGDNNLTVTVYDTTNNSASVSLDVHYTWAVDGGIQLLLLPCFPAVSTNAP